MSSGHSILAPKEDDVSKMLMAGVHLGSKNVNHQMTKYVYKRKADGTNVFDLHKTWEKMLLAARIIVAVENPKDVTAISGREFGTRAVLKFCGHVGASPIAGRYTPGTFTNQIQKAFREPRVLIVTDPRVDHQPIREASYANLPVIALVNSDSPLRFVDCGIPCNNNGVQSIGLMWWFMAREVLRFRGTIVRSSPWEVMPDLYFYRDPEDVEKEEAERARAEAEAQQAIEAPADYAAEWTGDAAVAAPVADFAAAPAPAQDWNAAAPAAGATEDWGAGGAQQWNAK